VTETPLWFYVLREAEKLGGRLGAIGGRIVAETFHRAIEGSRISFLHEPNWRPTGGRHPGGFGMVDLLLKAYSAAMSRPIVVISMVDGSSAHSLQQPRAWHIDAAQGPSTASVSNKPCGDPNVVGVFDCGEIDDLAYRVQAAAQEAEAGRHLAE
jgi:hypothetical protein